MKGWTNRWLPLLILLLISFFFPSLQSLCCELFVLVCAGCESACRQRSICQCSSLPKDTGERGSRCRLGPIMWQTPHARWSSSHTSQTLRLSKLSTCQKKILLPALLMLFLFAFFPPCLTCPHRLWDIKPLLSHNECDLSEVTLSL